MMRRNVSFLLGLILIIFFWIAVGSIATSAAYPLLQAVFPDLSIHTPAEEPLGFFLLAHISFLTLFAGIILACRWFAGSSVTKLATDSRSFRLSLAGRAFLIWFLLFNLLTGIQLILFPGEIELTFSPRPFLLFLPAVLLLTPLQSLCEELLFRSYLWRWASSTRLAGSPVLLCILSGIIFMLVHWGNPEFHRYGGTALSLYYILYGGFLMAVTLKDRGIEAAVGIHTANNVFSLMVMNYEGSVLPSPSIWRAAEVSPAGSTAVLLLLAGCYWLLRIRTRIIDSPGASL